MNTRSTLSLSLCAASTLLTLGVSLAAVAGGKPESAYFVRCDRSTTTMSLIDLSDAEIAARAPVAAHTAEGLLIEGLVLDVDPALAATGAPLAVEGQVWLETLTTTVSHHDAAGRLVWETATLDISLEAVSMTLSTRTDRAGVVTVIADMLFDIDALTTDGDPLAGDAEITLKLAVFSDGSEVWVPDLVAAGE